MLVESLPAATWTESKERVMLRLHMCRLWTAVTPLTDSSSSLTVLMWTSRGVPAGKKNKADARCHERTTCSQRKGYFHNKHPVFTFHQYSEDVLCDGKCRSNDEHREQERANRICYFIFRL